MCATCGCSDEHGVTITEPGAQGVRHEHPHDHDHPHEHGNHDSHSHTGSHSHPHGDAIHDEPDPRLIRLEQQVLAKNDSLAQHNRGWLEARETFAINLMSSPGSGKTTLLERTIRDTAADLALSVVEGDQATVLDGDRIKATGARVVQVNTGAGCHLDADMLRRALRTLDPPLGSIVVIENVGNLVCPALFDLGEGARVVVMSVTEGDDKPRKYPHMFRTADLVLLNKTDLLPYVDFDVEKFTAAVQAVKPDAEIRLVSATKGDGMDTWYAWLRARTVIGSPGLTESAIDP